MALRQNISFYLLFGTKLKKMPPKKSNYFYSFFCSFPPPMISYVFGEVCKCKRLE